MKTKSRYELINQVYRIAEFDRVNNGNQWWCGVCDNNTERANNVWRIFNRYQENIINALGHELLTKEDYLKQFPTSVYAK